MNIVSYFRDKKEEKKFKNMVVFMAMLHEKQKIVEEIHELEDKRDERIRKFNEKYPFLSADHIEDVYDRRIKDLRFEYEVLTKEQARYMNN